MEGISSADNELCQYVAKYGVAGAYERLMPDVKRPELHLRAKLHSGRFRGRLSELMDLSGLSLVQLNSKLKELTEAQRPLVIDGNIEMVADNPTQIDAVKTAYKLHKVLGNDTNINVDARKIELNIDEAGMERLSVIASELNQLALNMNLDAHKIKVASAELVE